MQRIQGCQLPLDLGVLIRNSDLWATLSPFFGLPRGEAGKRSQMTYNTGEPEKP